jgi:hypothetical protein
LNWERLRPDGRRRPLGRAKPAKLNKVESGARQKKVKKVMYIIFILPPGGYATKSPNETWLRGEEIKE